MLEVLMCGTKVKVLDLDGEIAAINIEDRRVQYKVLWTKDGELKEAWFPQAMVRLRGEGQQEKIGFKR